MASDAFIDCASSLPICFSYAGKPGTIGPMAVSDAPLRTLEFLQAGGNPVIRQHHVAVGTRYNDGGQLEVNHLHDQAAACVTM